MKGEKRAQVKGARVKIELNLIEMIYGQVNSSFSPSLIYYTYIYCVVPENIQTPTTEGIGNSRGVGGSEAQEIPEGRGVGP